LSNLVIRQEQIRALEHAREEDFVIRKSRWAADRCGFRDGPDLRTYIKQAARSALGHGITRNADVEVFVELALLYGADFETQYETAGEILARDEIDGARKIRLLENWELFERPPRRLPE
jgi:hypothetical protein